MVLKQEFKSLDKSIRKQKIIDTAASLFHRKGYVSTTLDDVAKELGINTIELLPFHRLCASKYTKLQKVWKLDEVVSPSQERLEELQEIFTAQGLNCTF